MTHDLESDIAAIAGIDAVPTILDVVCRVTGMGFAAVARVTPERWVACAVKDEIQFGLRPGGELQIETTICHEIRQSGEGVVIDHVAEDERFRNHHTPALYGFQSYISVPIVLPSGVFFGTLCAIDTRPARLQSSEIKEMFKLFAQLIGFHLDASRKIAESEARLLDERKTSELREQFIAVLGHDLRNPLASIAAGAKLLQKEPLGSKATSLLSIVENSVERMAELIDNVLDFARGRLGGGLVLDRGIQGQLGSVLAQVVDELRTSWPDRLIEADLSIDRPVNCDRARMAQLLSNLLGNALTHGAPNEPVRVVARTVDNVFSLSVSNKGQPILPHTVERLFQPFFRVAPRPGQQGLGLGLYIASEIARAHGGDLRVVSTTDETRFTFTVALASSPGGPKQIENEPSVQLAKIRN